MWAVRESCFRRSSKVQPLMSGSRTSSVMALGWNSRASEMAVAPRRATTTFMPRLCARSTMMRAKVASSSTISSTRSSRVTRLRSSSTTISSTISTGTVSSAGGRIRSSEPRGAFAGLERQRDIAQFGLRNGRDIDLRQVQREAAACADDALQANFAAQQARQFAADGKAQVRCRRTFGWWCRRPAGTLRR